MRASVEHGALRDLQGRFQRISLEDRERAREEVLQATELVYRQARENISRMFRNPGPMESALRMTFDRLLGAYRGSVSIEGVGYVTQEFGGSRPYQILPHGQALKFQAERYFGSRETETIFTPMVIHPPLPERSFLRLALDQKRAEIEALFAGRLRARFEE